MSLLLKNEYAHAFKVWLAEQKTSVLNAGPEPQVPAGLTPDEARKIREQAKVEVG